MKKARSQTRSTPRCNAPSELQTLLMNRSEWTLSGRRIKSSRLSLLKHREGLHPAPTVNVSMCEERLQRVNRKPWVPSSTTIEIKCSEACHKVLKR